MKEMGTKEKFANLRPIVLACLAMVGGITCAYHSFLHTSLIALFVFIALALSFLSVLIVKGENKLKLLTCLLIVFACFSFGYVNSAVRIDKATNTPFNNQRGEFVGRIYERKNYGNVVLLRFENVSFSGSEIDGKSEVYLFSNEIKDKLDIGSVVTFKALIKNRVLNGDKDQKIFSGIYYQLEEVENIAIIDFEANFFEFGYLKARRFLKENLSTESASIALAITLGDTSYFQENKLENYRYAGIAHVFAVSGLHVGVMVSCFTFLCNKLKIKRRWKPLFVLLPAFVYCGLCGFRPSSLRAFIMAFCAITADYVGFKKDNLSSCALAGIILLVVNPFNLYDYGFKLSFLAVTSIFAFSPAILRNTKKLKWVNQPLALTLSAQAGTLPVLTRMSGYTSIITVLSNIFFVPVSVVLYVFTIVCFALSAFLSLFFEWATLIMKAPDFLINAIDLLISKIDFSSFAIPSDFGVLSVLWYVGLACVSDYFNFSKKNKLILLTVTVLTVFLGSWLLSLK